MTEPNQRLPPCPYRKAHLGQLICAVAREEGGDTSRLTTAEICRDCFVPGVLEYVNCLNFSPGVMHYATVHEIINAKGDSVDCPAIGFDSITDYQTKCSPECPAFRALHQDLTDELPLEVQGLPEQPTDRDLRQAVLLALYQYHARHPERFGQFDMTLVFLATSLRRTVADLLRVILPMEAREELRTLQENADTEPRWVTLTATGVQAMNSEVLFEHTGVRVVSGDHIEIKGDHNQVASRSEKVEQSQHISEKLSNLLPHFAALRDELLKPEVDLPEVERSDALAALQEAEEAIKTPGAKLELVIRPLRSVSRIMEARPATTGVIAIGISTLLLMVQAAYGG